MAPDTYLDRLRSRLRDFIREHGVLGFYHSQRLYDELNDLECDIAREQRRQERHAGRRSWWWFLVPGVASVSTEAAHG